MNKREVIQSKIVKKEELLYKRNIWRFLDQKVVFTNGCFDIVHYGHVDYLAMAASLGNRMIVGLNSDRSVGNLKGEGRPVQNERSRALIMAAFQFVDAVVLFDEETPFELISFLQPDILVKGSDYAIDRIVGADIVLANGGRVETIDFVEGYSTTSIIQKIRKDV